jgi:chorismate mutase
MVGQVRRYQAPDEHPFFPEGLPEPILPSLPLSKVRFNLNFLF